MDEQKRQMEIDAFLSRKWSFPPPLDEVHDYEKDIEQCLRVLLSTTPDERANRYAYGCPLHRYAFEPMTTQTTSLMRNDITRAIILYEPRITLEDVSFEEQPENDLLLIRLTYTVTRTNNRNNMVYPLYLNEGTNV